jgi:ABC-type sulfate transport system permease component
LVDEDDRSIGNREPIVSLEEAAKDLGANPQETFRRVTLPLLTPPSSRRSS